MTNELTKSYINLYAVLRNIEDLCELDQEMKQLIQDINITIKFVVRQGPKGYLIFQDGTCIFTKTAPKCHIILYFTSPHHFNQMVIGEANPIPIKGLTKINFLKNQFMTLTNKLSFYLKPTPSHLKNPNYLTINTILTAYAAFFALAQIGNTDPIGQLNAKRMPNGIINVSVIGGSPALHITVNDGRLAVKKGLFANPRASMTFSDITATHKILTGEADTYSCMATENLQMKGFIPMLDNMNKLLSQVSNYLQ